MGIDVVVLGHIIIETIVFPDGRVVSPVLGSPAAYSSVALARLGTHVGLCTKVGVDMPEEFLEIFKKAGVDISGVKIVGQKSTHNKLIYVTMENKRVEYLAKAPHIEITDLPESYKKANIFYLCPMDYEVDLHIAQKLVEMEKTVVVDLGGYGGATSAEHPYGIENKLLTTIQIIKLSNIIKTSIEDCQYIFGYADSPNYYAEKMLKIGGQQVIITLGSKGVFYANATFCRYFPPLRCLAIDTTGAGDVFAAGLLHSYLKGAGIEDMITFGQAVACHVIERTGGVVPERMPTREEVLLRINKGVRR
jgi:sugar/nucleoside kinase (ribokinase family)